VAVFPHCTDGSEREVLVGEEPHRSGGEWIDLLTAQQCRGVSAAGSNVVALESWVLRADLLVAPALGKQFQYEVNGQPSAANHGLPSSILASIAMRSLVVMGGA
jgi:hypothetical protein